MLLHFTRLVNTSRGYLTFHFNRITTIEGTRYHITCMDQHRKVYTCYMAPKVNRWILTPTSKCPLWLRSLEADFEAAILESPTQTTSNF